MGTFGRVCISLLLWTCSGTGSFARQDATRSAPPQAPDPAPPPLPEGTKGIASRHPGDWGIEKDPAVVFADGVESGLGKWNRGSWNGVKVSNDPAHVHGGKGSLEITINPPSPGKASGMGIGQHFADGFDTLFVRYYVKFEKVMDMLGHNHASCCIAGSVAPGTTAGVPADGRNQFICCLEPTRSEQNVRPPGEMNIYCYHMDQRSQWGDHFFPNGGVWPLVSSPPAKPFGDHFVSRPNFVPDRERWICCELMLKLNTLGKRDGRIAYWFDGRLAADFPNLRFRAIPELKINDVSFGCYTMNSSGAVCTMWFDDIVAATSYIGPIARGGTGKDPRAELKAASDLIAQGELGKAYQHLENVPLEKEPEEIVAQIRSKMKAILDIAWKRMEDAQVLASVGEKADAIQAYQDIIREFPTLAVATEAKTRIEALRAPTPKRK